MFALLFACAKGARSSFMQISTKSATVWMIMEPALITLGALALKQTWPSFIWDAGTKQVKSSKSKTWFMKSTLAGANLCRCKRLGKYSKLRTHWTPQTQLILANRSKEYKATCPRSRPEKSLPTSSSTLTLFLSRHLCWSRTADMLPVSTWWISKSITISNLTKRSGS